MDNFCEVFVSATEFCRNNKSQQIKSQNFVRHIAETNSFTMQNFSSPHEAICHYEVSP